ncbi:hypothetical protein FE773_02350 [Caminibacter mediatlanticus TB-2]|uniref:Uncharacterized protein n=1 Tax=Caminibacter mediatlanticus TB-2 TaxID=391592 RepID=A0AAI9AH17_9BACT|nr:hypothetical protein [Caminibacter mediatlanticus]EDM23487.1 hypothetical protein CMTB2_08127 [Caminibacter mediatlanticus TB-2]QCT94057.1 hypothetical protein FE773_02350 [Caminibacter mediatlanticus TB-2]
MFNVKITSFFSKIANNRKEQKYLKRLIENIENEELKLLIKKFLYASSFMEIEKFLKSQNIIDYQITPEDFQGTLNDLKEKIAFELNEALLKKYNS